jgi:hypothetical protein
MELKFFFWTFNRRHCVLSKPLCFERWLFPCPHVNPFDRASLYLWTLSTEQLAYTLQTWQWFFEVMSKKFNVDKAELNFIFEI